MTKRNQTRELIYGNFALRLGAFLIDGAILSPWIYMLCFYNLSAWRSFPLFIFGQLIYLGYKVYCEYKYGHTIGKWIFNLNCVSLDSTNLSLWQAILRNLFFILPLLIRLPYYYTAFYSEDFNGLESFLKHGPPLIVSCIFASLQVLDIATISANEKKKALHDRLAGTLVIVEGSK